MPSILIEFECIVVDGMVYDPFISIPRMWKFNSEQEAVNFKNRKLSQITDSNKNIIHSSILGKTLNCIDINKCEDEISTLIVCNLDDPIYEMYIIEYRIFTK